MRFSVAVVGVAVVAVAALCVVTGGCYRPAYQDCELRCASGSACPDGLTCDSLTNQCRAEGASCDGIDASIADVAMPGCAVEISATRKHTCVRRGDGSVVCWGLTQYGEAGPIGSTMCLDGTSMLPCNRAPTLITLPAPSKLLGTGDYHSCAVLTDDSMWCWGNNDQQRFGNNLATTSSPPTNVGRSGARAIAAGNAHTCTLGIPSAGAVMCSGENREYQVGDGTMTARPLPVATAPGTLPGALAISSGFTHNCAITNTGVWCWGVNDYGQTLPNAPTGAPVAVPTSVSGTPGVKALALGLRHTCFITSTDGVRCFGHNAYGQLGLGTPDPTAHPPGDVSGLTTNVGAIASGYYQTCALKTDGSVWCWGQIGGNTISSPAQVSLGGTTAKKIAVGTFHACAILADDTVACWGDNSVGQLGDGTITASMLTTPLVCP